MKNFPILITPGEPSGIGPDLIVLIFQKKWPIKLVICCDPKILIKIANKLNLSLKLNKYIENNNYPNKEKEITVLEVKSSVPVFSGKLNKLNSNYVIKTLYISYKKCINKKFSALITGPVNKKIINDFGIKFTVHTEYFKSISKSKSSVMMLVYKKFRLALATTHVPLCKVSKLINKKSFTRTIVTLKNYFNYYFNISNPRIYVSGLNPHAGEGGYLGKEEINIIIPVIKKLKKIGYNIFVPFPADTIFQKKYFSNSDVFLLMYHDQGLPVIKYKNFGKLVNITLGLPFIRTSVDYGSAIDLAGKNIISSKSIENAIKLTNSIINNYNEKKL